MDDPEQVTGSGMADERAEGIPNADALSESELRAALAKSQAEAASYHDSWLRSAADLSNARKRMARELDEHRAIAAARVIEKLIPVMDDLDRAFASAPAGEANAEWLAGFRMIQRKLEGVLDAEGVAPIPAEGRMFDPTVHEAMTHEEAEGYDEGQVIAEVARGYRLGDKVLRPSMVRVAKGENMVKGELD